MKMIYLVIFAFFQSIDFEKNQAKMKRNNTYISGGIVLPALHLG